MPGNSGMSSLSGEQKAIKEGLSANAQILSGAVFVHL